MNAMTFDDHTSYPVSSTIPRDLANLMDVYCDATFFPLLRLADFQQEGWRFEEDEIKGVVFNEMKNYQSDQTRALFNAASSAFLKGTNYQFVSGGVPASIPRLRYEDLLEFHRTHYHPSNCLLYTYGDIHPSHHMRFLDSQLLQRFHKEQKSKSIHVSTVPSAVLNATERSEFTAPPNADSNSQGWHYLRIVPTNLTTESEDTLKLQLLSMLLFRGQSSPFYKSMIESKKAQLFNPIQGYMAFSKNSFFGIGGSEIPLDVSEKEFEEMIQKTLEDVLHDGFEERRINGLLNELELSIRQKVTRANCLLCLLCVEFGLSLMQGVATAWTHNADPTFCLLLKDQLQELREKGVNNVMKEMIRKYLLPANNRGVKTVIVKPDAHYFDKIVIALEMNKA